MRAKETANCIDVEKKKCFQIRKTSYVVHYISLPVHLHRCHLWWTSAQRIDLHGEKKSSSDKCTTDERRKKTKKTSQYNDVDDDNSNGGRNITVNASGFSVTLCVQQTKPNARSSSIWTLVLGGAFALLSFFVFLDSLRFAFLLCFTCDFYFSSLTFTLNSAQRLDQHTKCVTTKTGGQ